MVVPFGVGVGDFIAGVSLLYTIFKSLSDSKGSSKEYLEAITTIRSLENALVQVRVLHEKISNEQQRLALEKEVVSCEATVDAFLGTISMYHGHLSIVGPASTWRDRIKKVRWHITRSNRLSPFFQQLSQHTAALEVVLLTIQTSIASRQEKAQKEIDEHVRANSAALMKIQTSTSRLSNSLTRIEATSIGCRQETAVISTEVTSLSTTIEHYFNALQNSLNQQTCQNQEAVGLATTLKQLIMINNAQQAELLTAVKMIQTSLPAQVLLQQPFIFVDAVDRPAPIHLDWIDS